MHNRGTNSTAISSQILAFRVVNGPTSPGPNPARTRKYKPEPNPNPKTNLKPKSCLQKPESHIRSEKFSNVAELF